MDDSIRIATIRVSTLVCCVIDALGYSFSLEQLRTYVRSVRHRPLHIISSRTLLAPDDTGACVPMLDADVIILPADLDPILVVISQLHEIGHLLLHAQKTTNFSYQTFCDAIGHPGTLHSLRRHGEEALCEASTVYNTPIEMEAELFASLMYQYISDDYRFPLDVS